MNKGRRITASRITLATTAAIIAATIIFAVGAEDLTGQTRTTSVRAHSKTSIPASARSTVTGIFMGWGKGLLRKDRVVAIKFVPKGRATKALMNMPYITPPMSSAAWDSIMHSVAKRLKIGQKIELEYASYNGWVWVLDLKQLDSGGSGSTDSASTAQHPVDKFTFIGAKKVKTSGGIKMHIVARRGSNMWRFHAPFEPADEAERGAPKVRKTVRPEKIEVERTGPKTLSQTVSQFKSGDVVAIKYDTNTDAIDYKFVLTSITPYMETSVGTLTRVGKRTMRGKKYDMAYIRAGKVNKVLTVPLKAREGSNTDPSELLSTLKSLGGAEGVFTYYKKKGVTWLDNVTAK